MSLSVMVVVSLVYIALLFGATMHNHLKKQQDLFISSVFALGMYAIGHLGSMLWLSKLSGKELLEVHYLYFAAFQIALAAGLFLINRKKLRVMMSITIVLLVAEALLGYAVHIDRNVIALNGASNPNGSISESWLLWDLITVISQLTTFTVLLALTLPRIFQVKTENAAVAYKEQEKVKQYSNLFKPSSRKNKTHVFLATSAENLCFYTGDAEESKHRMEAGILLLNEAIKLCCYEPGRTRPVGLVGRFVYWLRS